MYIVPKLSQSPQPDVLSGIHLIDPAYKMEFDYDDYAKRNSFKWGVNQVSSSREFGRITSLKGLISKIHYDSYGNIESADYEGGLTLKSFTDGKGRLLSNELGAVEQSFSYDLLDKVTKYSLKSEQKQQSKTYNYKNEKPLLSKVSPASRDDLMRLHDSGDLNFEYRGNSISKIITKEENIDLYYSATGELLGSCKEGVDFKIGARDCWLKIDSDNFVIGAKKVSLIRASQKALGVLIDGKFYPVILDHRGSIVAAFDKTKTLFIRHYNDWGQKTVEYFSEEARQIERLIVWDFAQMIHNPLLKNDDIYHAAYRSYSPVVGQWASLDPLFMKNPDQLISLRGNWNPVEYASGDPVNFVDPSGHFALPAMAMGAAVGGFFGAISGGIVAMATNSNLYNGIMVGMTTGAFIGSGASLVAGLTGTGAVAVQGAIGSIFGFTGNLVGQAGFTGKVDISQSFVAGIGGGMTTSFSAVLGHSFNGFAKDLGVGMSYMSTDIGFSLAADTFSFVSLGNSGFDSFSNSGDYAFGGSSSNGHDYWSSNPYE